MVILFAEEYFDVILYFVHSFIWFTILIFRLTKKKKHLHVFNNLTYNKSSDSFEIQLLIKSENNIHTGWSISRKFY